MDKNKSTEYRSIGEAHLYVAVAKADGVVSSKERLGAPYYAQKSQNVFNILKINENVSKSIKKYVTELLTSPRYKNWSAEQHLDQGVELLKKAKNAGEHGIGITVHKSKDGLLQVAFLDGYILKESKFIKKIEKRLTDL